MRRHSRLYLPFAALLLLSGCQTAFERRDPTGQILPSVRGKSLADVEYRLPEQLAGAPVVLILGFVMEAQFDIDRWLLGLAQAQVNARVYEVPTIPGLIPGMFAGSIDAGMRSGIPQEDWGSVITVYEDGGPLAEFTGNENPRNGRVLLLDGAGRVVFFHDSGYSAGSLLRLKAALATIKEMPRSAQ